MSPHGTAVASPLDVRIAGAATLFHSSRAATRRQRITRRLPDATATPVTTASSEPLSASPHLTHPLHRLLLRAYYDDDLAMTSLLRSHHSLGCVAFVLLLLCLPLELTATQCPATDLPTTAVYDAADCAWDVYDFSALAAVDLYGSHHNGAMSVFRLCGAVSDPVCSAASGGEGQLCHWGTNVSATPACSPIDVPLTSTAGYNFSTYNDTEWVAEGVTVTIYPATPALCNGVPAVTVVNLLCHTAAPAVPLDGFDYEIRLVNTSTSCPCTTVININTSLACYTPSSSSSSSSSSTGSAFGSIASSSSTGGSSATFSSTSSPAVSSSSSAPSAPFQCLSNPFGLNLSSLGVELLWQSNHTAQQWFVSLCGGVTDEYCNIFTPNSSVCGYDTCNPWSDRLVMSYASTLTSATNYAWKVTDGVNATNGIEYLQRNGQVTDGTRQQAVVRFVCDSDATTPYIAQIDVTPNTATVSIHTNLTCELVVTDKQYLCPSGCCGMGYDFTALDYDIYGYDEHYAVWGIHMCGPMTDEVCLGASICQNAACGGPVVQMPYGTTVSMWEPSQQSWAFINGRDWTGGVQMTTVAGVDCPNAGAGSTAFIAQFLCDPTALHPNTYTVVQAGQCVYQMTIYTAIVCSSPGWNSSALVLSQPLPTVPQVFGCQFEGYDLSPLSAYDLKLPYGYYLFVTRVCGQVNDAAAQLNPYMRNASVVQLTTYCGGLASEYLVSVWNPYLASTAIVSGGVQVTVVDGSNVYCVGPRGLKWIFACDRTARYAYLYSVVEEFGVNNCHYDLTIMTDIVCGASNQSATLALSSSSTGQSRLFNDTDNGANSVRGSSLLVPVGLALTCLFVLMSAMQL